MNRQSYGFIGLAAMVTFPIMAFAGVTSGTGFFITSTGYIATNYHVIKNSSELEVRDIRGTTLPAKLIKSDPANDLAIIKIEAKTKPLAIARSSTVRKGDPVFTIGFPNISMQGLSAKVTEGTVSSLSGLRDEPGNFQVSVPVQPGNSGGPLINKEGHVVGVIVAKLSAEMALKSGSTIPEAVNYAVKSNYLLELIDTDINISEQIVAIAKPTKQTSLTKLVESSEPSVVNILAKSPDRSTAATKPGVEKDSSPSPQVRQDPNSFASLNSGVAAQASGNFSEAAALFRKAAEQGNDEAMFRLAGLYFHGRGVSKDLPEAARWLSKSANLGNSKAQTELGLMYANGFPGQPVDLVEAVRWYRKSADQGDPTGQASLGLMYGSGKGVARDDTEALRLFRMASDVGHPPAYAYLAGMYEFGRGGLSKDEIEAARLYRLAADKGEFNGQLGLGNLYMTGRGGLTKDEAEAARLFRKSADQGNTQAETNMGNLYMNGWGGLPKDEAEALLWYRKAAEKGHPQAEFNLGLMYMQGRGGLVKNPSEAERIFQKAAEKGNLAAQFSLGMLYENGQGTVKSDPVQSLSWYRKAAAQGYANAQHKLGGIYLMGWLGVTKDRDEAARWYQKAANQGHKEAIRSLELVKQ